jgi:threonine/homoserine/homoserine lactone efflux protein
MSFQTWSVFAVTEVALCMTPGPAVLFVVSQALRLGGPRSLWANAGILAGNSFYFALSATGLGALLLASHRLFLTLKWIGAAYLVFLGVTTFLQRADNPELSFSRTERGRLPVFFRGLVTQIANPKALVFFIAFLPQFIQAEAPIWPQILILGMTSLAIEFVVLGSYGFLAGTASAVARRPRFARATNRVSGALLIGAGAGLAIVESE